MAGPLDPDSGTGHASAYPEDVGRFLSYLANMIDSSIELRGVGNSHHDFAARHLGAHTTEVIATTRALGPLDFQLAGVAFTEILRDHPPVAVIGDDADEPPQFEQTDLGDRKLSLPYEVTAAFSAGTIADCPLVVTFEEHYNERLRLRVWSRARDSQTAETWLNDLLHRGRAVANPFRGRFVRASNRLSNLWFSIEDIAPAERDDVVLAPDVWAEIDRSVTGVFQRRELLTAAGLSSNRGVMLVGPPGTGKTALARVLANELQGKVTVVFCDAVVVSDCVTALYRELKHLAPALVVMEDVDLVVGHRHGNAAAQLNNFLVALDGAMSTHEGVVTLASTNDQGSIDAAAQRKGRFDAIVRVDPPGIDGRAAILSRYLRRLDSCVDVRRVALATDGWTGADLRELVTRAVLCLPAAGTLATDALLRIVREESTVTSPGQYL